MRCAYPLKLRNRNAVGGLQERAAHNAYNAHRAWREKAIIRALRSPILPDRSPMSLAHEIPACFNGRRYHVYNDWAKIEFGGRLQKVSIDAGFTCPNRDGSLGVGGCTFCNNEGFSPSYLRDQPDILTQIDTGIEFMRRRYPRTKSFLAYFQSYSNTYDDLDKLRIKPTILRSPIPEITGIVIGTRPDCLPDDVLDYHC